MDSITVVTGFGRCGSSLVMRMLENGGLPLYYEQPVSYETSEMLSLPADSAWLQKCVGKAVKILDPQRFTPPKGHSYRFIFISRDTREQAKSQLKLMSLSFPSVLREQRSKAITRLSDSLRRDFPIAINLLNKYPDSSVRVFNFEHLLLRPRVEAEKVQAFLELKLDIEAMVSAVVSRPPGCLDYFLEQQFI